MDTQQEEPKVVRETVAYSLPRGLIEAVARYAIEERSKSKSHAAQDIMEQGLIAYYARKAEEAA
jgi:hypothetical protein